MKLTKERFIQDFTVIKELAIHYFESDQLEKCVETISVLCRIGYETNIVYTDEEMEGLLLKISNSIVPNENIQKKTVSKRWIFYDSFGWDNRGLTQQYLRALKSWNVEILFIFENYNESLSKDIYKELIDYGAEIYCVDQNLVFNEKVQNIQRKIVEFSPSNAFLHFSPWTVVGFVVWNSLHFIDRYFINLTDHAFWLGKNTFDHCIEFRNYGYTISKLEREISEGKLVILPYYPLVDENKIFAGFPVETSGRKVVVSGSAFYKVFGEEDMFFKILKLIVENNKDVIIFFAGSGDVDTFNKLLEKYNLKNNVYLLGNRSDISEVIKRADVYLATYPLSGGLMGQFALKKNIPLIGFTDVDYSCNYLESLVDLKNDIQLTFFDTDSFIKEFNQLLNDRQYRQQRIDLQKDAIITPEDFNQKLYHIIYDKQEFYKKELIAINKEKFYKIYLNVTNKYSKFYDNFLLQHKDLLFTMRKRIIINYYLANKKLFLSIVKRKVFGG